MFCSVKKIPSLADFGQQNVELVPLEKASRLWYPVKAVQGCKHL